jgi:hypothetical protein
VLNVESLSVEYRGFAGDGPYWLVLPDATELKALVSENLVCSEAVCCLSET